MDLSLGFDVSRETKIRLQKFIDLFDKWARTINLVAPSTLSDFGERHLRDSAQIFRLFPEAVTWVDLGSGGGFPGMITAILLHETAGGWVHLVESNNKKAAFLRAAIAETGARASVHPIRIESAPATIAKVDAISARALAELSLLLEFSEPWMKANPDCRAFFHKGRDYQSEVDKAVGGWSLDLLKHDSVVERDSVVLEISHLSRIVSVTADHNGKPIQSDYYHSEPEGRRRQDDNGHQSRYSLGRHRGDGPDR